MHKKSINFTNFMCKLVAKNFLYIDTQTIIRLVEIHHFFQWRRRRKSPTQKSIRLTIPCLIINTRVCERMCCEESKNIVYVADISHRSWCYVFVVEHFVYFALLLFMKQLLLDPRDCCCKSKKKYVNSEKIFEVEILFPCHLGKVRSELNYRLRAH